MANEAVLVYETTMPLAFTCANGTGIEKGTCLTLSDPMTVAAVTTSTAATGGIAAEEKIASDGRTKISVYRGGVFKVVASGAITVGKACVITNSNKVEQAGPSVQFVAGTALETAANGETLLFELMPQDRST